MQTFGGRNDGDAKAVEDAWNLGVAGVETATGSGRAVEARDRGSVINVLHGYDDGLVTAVRRRQWSRRGRSLRL